LKTILNSLVSWRLLHDPSAQVFKDWAVGLADISDDHLRYGLRKTPNFKGYFDITAFVDLCKITPEDLGLPTVQAAYNEAANASYPKERARYSHPIVYIAGRETGWFEIANGVRGTFEHYKYNYEQLAKRLLNGEPIDMPVVRAIEKKPSVPSTIASASAHVSGILGMFKK